MPRDTKGVDNGGLDNMGGIRDGKIIQGVNSKGGRATLKMLRRKSKTQFVN